MNPALVEEARMGYSLAVFAPRIGVLSETFIRRHMRDLLPDGTVIVINVRGGRETESWTVDCPTLVLKRAAQPGVDKSARDPTRDHDGGAVADPEAAVAEFLQAHHVQVALGEYLHASLPWIGLMRKLGIRLFGYAHGFDVSRLLREPQWREGYRQFNEAAGVITVCEAQRAKLIALGLGPEKIHVVPTGVVVPPEPLKRVDRHVIRCLAVGRMVAKKGPILLLDAFRRALKGCPQLRLDYVGTGPLLPAVKQFVHALHLEKRVTIHGGQPHLVVKRLMRRADIFLQHSVVDPDSGDEEGLPVAIQEAMACSLPVVSTRHAGIPEAVVDGTTGYLVAEGDTVGMAERIVTLARDADLRRRMGVAGWERAKAQFSWERSRTELLRIFELSADSAAHDAERTTDQLSTIGEQV